MARSSRLNVCLAMVMRNSSNIHCARSISRQRTTPWIAGIGPLSIIRAIDWRWVSLSLAGLSRRLAVQQPVGPASVEPQHPIPDDLEINTTDLCRLGARRTVVD